MTRPVADLVKHVWTGTGTGTMTLGSVVAGFAAFPASLDGEIISYSIEHVDGDERETGIGTYTHSGTTLSRDFVTFSTAGAPAKQDFSAGTKFVRITALGLDVVENRAAIDPGVNDDITAGYVAGRSRWLNTSTDTLWFCVDHTDGAAVWRLLGEARLVGGFGADAALTSAWLSDIGLTGSAPVTAALQAYGLTTAFTVTGAPQRQANGAVRTVANEATSNDKFEHIDQITRRTALVIEVNINIAADWTSTSRLFSADSFTNGFGFFINGVNIGVMSGPSTSTSQAHNLVAGRQLIGLYLDHGEAGVTNASGHLIVVDPAGNTLQDRALTFGAGGEIPDGEDIIVVLGNNTAAAGRIGTHDFYGYRLIKSIPAGLSSALIKDALLAEMRKLTRDANPLLRARPDNPTFRQVTAAEVQAGVTLTQTADYMLVELAEDLSAAGSITLPAAGLRGLIVKISRKGGGFFDLTETVTGTKLAYKGDYVTFLRGGTTWRTIESQANGRTGVRRRGAGSYNGDILESRTVQVFTAAASYDVGDALGANTGFEVTLLQRGTGVVTATLGGGLTKVPASAALATNGDGSALHIIVIGSSQVWVHSIADPTGDGGEAVVGGTFDPTNITIAARETIYSPYSQTGAVSVGINNAGSTFHGGVASVSWVANNAGSGVSSVITWPADTVDGITGQNADLPATLPSGAQQILFRYNETLDVVEVYFGRATAARISFAPTGGIAASNVQAAIAELDSEKLSKVAAGAVLSDAELQDISETSPAVGNKSGAASFDYTAGGVQRCSVTGNITSMAITNPPASGKAGMLTIVFQQDATGGRTIAWGSAFRFPGGTDHTLSAAANAIDIFTLVTWDAGTTWYVGEFGKAWAA